VRKAGAPRTVAGEVFHDGDRLYYASADSRALAVARGPAPASAKDVVRPKWVRRFDLPVRAWGAEAFDKDTLKVVVEVFRDSATKQLIYASESGALAVLPDPGRAVKEAEPRFLYRLPLKVRPAGEVDLDFRYLKLNVEVYHHEPTGHLIYVGHNGALAVVETKKDFRDLKKSQPPRWSHALELKARKVDEADFTPTTARLSAEVYADDDANTAVYATDALTLAVVSGAPGEKRKPEPPLWRHRLVSGKFAAEVYSNPNAGHGFAVTHTGALAVWVEEPRGAAPTVAADSPRTGGVTVTGVGVIAHSGKVLFVPGETGVEAVALFNGKALWTAEGTGDPLLATAEHVFAQVPVKGKKNQVKLVVLEAPTGERLRDSEVIEFPEWVSVPVEYGHSFRSAARLDKDTVLYVWEARTFSDREPPALPDPNAKRDGGAFRLDPKTGRVSVVKGYDPKDQDFPNTLYTAGRVGDWVLWVEHLPSTRSAPHNVARRVLKAERTDGTGAWKRPIAGAVDLAPRP
jgi:hypothetical protein